MKVKVFLISVIVLIGYLIVDSFKFLYLDFLESYPIIEHLLLLVFVITNFLILIYLLNFSIVNGFQFQRILLLIALVGELMYPLLKYLDDYLSFITKTVNVVVLLVLVLDLVIFMISLLIIKREGLPGLKEIKMFAKWFLISIGLGIAINVLVRFIKAENLTDLSTLPMIIPYYYIYRYGLTLKEKKPAANTGYTSGGFQSNL